MRLKLGILFLAFAALSSCQTKPTRTSENRERKLELAKSAARAIEITPATVIVDARPAFEYSMAHIPKSVPLTWSDFTEPEPAQRGILQADLFTPARRLARLGIGPQTHVVVVGQGKTGDGAEGRMAWTLAYMGVTNVQFAAIDFLKPRYTTTVETSFPPEIPMWKPELQESLNASRDEVLFAINKRAVKEPLSYQGADARLYRIVDVRSEKAYLGKDGLGAVRRVPNMDAINIPWTQFFTTGLRPDPEIASKLKSVGITPNERILVIDENGVSSAAVTMALRAFGYEHAANVSGGLTDLMSTYQ